MGFGTMGKSKTKTRRTTEIVILLFVLVCMVLIFAEISTNVIAEFSAQENQSVIKINDDTLTPVPTLTEEEYQNFINIENVGSQTEP